MTLSFSKSAALFLTTTLIGCGDVKPLSYLEESAKIVQVKSPGGHSDDYSNLSEKYLDNGYTIEVIDLCISACAEYLLMAGDPLVFTNQPIIGMHGSPLINRIVKYRSYPELSDNCLVTSAKKLFDLQQEAGVPYSYNLYQIERLEVDSVDIGETIRGCVTKTVNFKNYMWLPTSHQLQTQMNLKFEGAVCADNFEICSNRVDQRWKKGTRVVIGEDLYIPKGNHEL